MVKYSCTAVRLIGSPVGARGSEQTRDFRHQVIRFGAQKWWHLSDSSCFCFALLVVVVRLLRGDSRCVHQDSASICF